MKNPIYILIVLLIVCNSFAHSQEGYLGKTRSVSIGLSSNFPLIPFKGGEDYRLEFEENSKVFFPKIDLGYSIQKKRTVVDFEARYQMLPNAVQYDFYGEAGPSQEIYIKDTTKMRSDVYRLGIYLKKFNHVAPIGLYFRFGGGLNILSTKSVSRKNTVAYIYSQDVWENSDDYSIDRGISLIGDVSISMGKLIPLSRKLTLDFGVQTNFPLVRFKFDDSTADNLLNPLFRRWIIGRSMFSHNIIEAYVKIHLFH